MQLHSLTYFGCTLTFVASVNVLVPHCKIYNDASCDISADGQLLAVFIPSSQRGFPDEGILAVYSLAPHNLGEMLYTKRFGKCHVSKMHLNILASSACLDILHVEFSRLKICHYFWKVNGIWNVWLGSLWYTQDPTPSRWACLQWVAMWWWAWLHAGSCSILPLTTWWRKCSVCSSRMEEKLQSEWVMVFVYAPGNQFLL